MLKIAILNGRICYNFFNKLTDLVIKFHSRLFSTKRGYENKITIQEDNLQQMYNRDILSINSGVDSFCIKQHLLGQTILFTTSRLSRGLSEIKTKVFVMLPL